MLLIVSFTMAQVEITGTVTNAKTGDPIPGVSVVVKGQTTIGTSTDMDGQYTLEVPSGAEALVFSFVGMQKKEVPIRGRNTIDVALQPSVEELQEVVVVGYGTSSKEALTGSVGQIEAENIEKTHDATFTGALKGRTAGVRMTTAEGQPGANPQVRIRGVGSISASSEPLYVVDGIPVTSGDLAQTEISNENRSTSVLSTINPGDIESITVLKDAAATAIYGSRGANGVILIETKTGEKGEAQINFSAQYGVSDAAYNNLLEPIEADQYKTLFIQGYTNRPDNPMTEQEALDLFNDYFPKPANTDWLDEISRQGNTHQYSLNASGGDENLRYYTSGSYYNREGFLIGADLERYSLRLNLNTQATENLRLQNNLSLGRTVQHGVEDETSWSNPMYNAYLLPPQVPVKNEAGLYYGAHKRFIMAGNNPVGKMSGDDARWLKQTRILDNLSATYDITDQLTFKTAWNFDLLFLHEFVYQNGRYGDDDDKGGEADEATTNEINWVGTQTLNYNNVFADSHSVDVLLGYEAQKNDRRYTYSQASGFPTIDLKTLANAGTPSTAWSSGTKYSFVSLFSRLNYNFKSRYFLSFSFRRDGSSRFGEENRYGNFWSVGASWRLAEEAFLQNVDWINDLKIKGSYGITGNADIGNFAAKRLFGFGQNYDGRPGSGPSAVGNPFLTWEQQANYDLSMSFRLFDMLSGSVTYYNRKNEDLILDRPISLTSGFDDHIENVANMVNKGLEIEMNADVVQSPNLNWNVGFNFSTLKNEVTKLDEPIITDVGIHQEGHDFYEFYLYPWAGVNPQTGLSEWYTDETLTNKSSDYRDTEKVFTGKSAMPSAYGALTTRLDYKNFTLDMIVNFEWDKYIYDDAAFVIHGDGHYTPRSTSKRAFEGRWMQPGDQTLFPQHYWGNVVSNVRDQSRFLMDGTYARLGNVTLSYNLPQKTLNSLQWLNVRSVRIYIKASNYLTWTRNQTGDFTFYDLYVDPENQINGVAETGQPPLKTLSFGLDLGL